MTADERKIKTHAAFLRRRFEQHSEIIRDIVARMPDEQLIAMEAENHRERVGKMVEDHKRGTLGRVSEKAIAALAPVKEEKRRGWFRRKQ